MSRADRIVLVITVLALLVVVVPFLVDVPRATSSGTERETHETHPLIYAGEGMARQ